MRTLALVALLAVGAAGVAVGETARPEPSDSVARKHWRRGLKLFEKERYDDASVQFWAGWALEPFSPFLFAWAQAERLAGDCPTAVTLYRRFLSEKPPADQAQRARVGLELCSP
jgi:hypothetical protein